MRTRQIDDMMQIAADELTVLPLYFHPAITAIVSAPSGPTNTVSGWDVQGWTYSNAA